MTSTFADADVDPPAPSRRRLLFNIGWIAFGFAIVWFGYLWFIRPKPDAPVVFLHATIVSGTGELQSDMTVAVADGRIVFVGEPGVTVPASLSRARRVDTLGAWLAAATFDHRAEKPLEGLRHVWVGEMYEGAPGDVVLTTVPQRGRGGGVGTGNPSGRQYFGAVVNRRYYTAKELGSTR